ncbi:hypothetical protein FRC20_009743 [Serendipita sp. 405]|nr:hypothetical protein FRC20_009743 [Serendipita sp. 405]
MFEERWRNGNGALVEDSELGKFSDVVEDVVARLWTNSWPWPSVMSDTGGGGIKAENGCKWECVGGE